MSQIRRVLTVLALGCALTASVYAGDMDCGLVPPPPPPTQAASATAEAPPTDGEIDCGAPEVLTAVLQGVLSVL